MGQSLGLGLVLWVMFLHETWFFSITLQIAVNHRKKKVKKEKEKKSKKLLERNGHLSA